MLDHLKIYRKSALSDFISDKKNVALVCSASFESRSLTIPLSLSPELIRDVYVLQNIDVAGKGSLHAEQICKHFSSHSEVIKISKTKPMETADEIVKLVKCLSDNKHDFVIIDISALTHEALLIMLRVFIDQDVTDKVYFVYNDAKEYDPGVAAEKKWLSEGVADIRSVIGYPGELRPSKKSHLIVLVGYEIERAVKLIERYEPSFLSLGIGTQSPINDGLYKVNKTYFERLIDRKPSAHKFEFSPTDVNSVKTAVLEISGKKPDHNVIVAPMNTKISTLGVGLAAIEKPTIQICYGKASLYNVNNYCEPSECIRIVPLSSLV